MRLWRFVCNPYQENAYLVAVGQRAWVIDPGFYSENEQQRFLAVLREEQLALEAIYLTHAHIDHILGVPWVVQTFGVPLYYHEAEEMLYTRAPEWAQFMGLRYTKGPAVTGYVEEGRVYWGEMSVRILHVPGHSPGSVAYFFEEAGQVLSGDVLFQGGIGNYHLPLADYETLMQSIVEKLLPIGEATIVWPGHGPETTIAHEKAFNPFLQNAF